MATISQYQSKSWGSQHKFSQVQGVLVRDGDIFTVDSPKAYAPLGYGAPVDPSIVKAADFKNDIPLPTYEERPPLKVNRPLAATFSDTELQRPNSTRLSRKQTLREDRPEVKGSRMDPIKAIVLAHHKTKRTLMLGKTPLSEDTFNTSKGDLDKFLKREREHTTEPEESFKGSKKAKIENVKSERDNELYTNEHTVRPENVLMMVDSSLVDTPERRRYNEQNNNHSQEATAITGRISGIGYKREHEYENVYDQEYDQENSQNGQPQDNKIADYNVEARPPGYLRARGKGYGSQEEEDGSQRQPRASHGIWRGKQDEKSLRYY